MTQARDAGIDRSISDVEVIEMHNSVEMMKRLHLWSFGGKALPLVRDERVYGAQSWGVMVNVEGVPPFRVYLGNMFAVAFGKPIADLLFIDYDSAEAAADAGWEVD